METQFQQNFHIRKLGQIKVSHAMLFANLLLLRLKNTLLEHVFAKFQTADTLILRHLIRF